MFQNNEYKNNGYFPFTPIYNSFIENYMKNSNSSFIIVYIYLLKESFAGNTITTNSVAQKLQILQADVLTALKFWQEKGVINYYIDEEDFIKITFLPCLEQNENNELSEKTNVKLKPTNRPNYTNEEIDNFYEQDEIKQLFKMAERIFGKPFNYTDRQVILSLYTWLEIPMDVLAILFTYCSTNGKTRVRYIEKVAIDWTEKGIDTVSKAEQYINVINDYKEILRAFGITNREPIEKEIETMKPWLIDFKMPLDIIKEACTRTILQTGKLAFKYTDTIIKNWHKQGVRTFEDIKRLDSSFEQKQNNNTPNPSKQPQTIRPSKFINYEQPKYDFDKMRELELKRLKERAGK